MLLLFPEILGPKSSIKYSRACSWLFVRQGIIHHALRDLFSAGGQITYMTKEGRAIKLPKALKILIDDKKVLFQILDCFSETELLKAWFENIDGNRRAIWVDKLKHIIVPKLIDENIFYELLDN